jgi:hypothetical protein
MDRLGNVGDDQCRSLRSSVPDGKALKKVAVVLVFDADAKRLGILVFPEWGGVGE